MSEASPSICCPPNSSSATFSNSESTSKPTSSPLSSLRMFDTVSPGSKEPASSTEPTSFKTASAMISKSSSREGWRRIVESMCSIMLAVQDRVSWNGFLDRFSESSLETLS
eukprot:Blabericola_migrator_1__765@NODE_118_length_13653_cov_35_432504_g106_i0_p9_GENE_NODE_118_length_13653_cov_35_432504_g106_i0NODE_118_length_13653_cov_35_432504_g106_i0_p9_ORF_typecomplete_len111_score13_25Ses_B/PF17046_5/0_87_NODE_118_length_13653_cov_35_432504_g106_i053805712